MKPALPNAAAIVVLRSSALPLARRIQQRLPGAEILSAEKGAVALFRSLLRERRPIVETTVLRL